MRILLTFAVDKVSAGNFSFFKKRKQLTIGRSAGQSDMNPLVLGELTNEPAEPQAIMLQASVRYQRTWRVGNSKYSNRRISN